MSSPAAPPTEALVATVPSPCVSVCRIDPASGWCEGCLRTIDEISHWSLLDDDEKRAVWSELQRRRTRR
jgi:hypothetical protein